MTFNLSTFRSSKGKGNLKPHEERKFIVFEKNLLGLFATCPMCAGSAEAMVLKEIGTLVKVQYWCTEEKCQFTDVWWSQPLAKGKMPVGNLQLSSSILVSGKGWFPYDSHRSQKTLFSGDRPLNS